MSLEVFCSIDVKLSTSRLSIKRLKLGPRFIIFHVMLSYLVGYDRYLCQRFFVTYQVESSKT